MPSTAKRLGGPVRTEPEELVELGRVLRARGLRGALLVELHSADPENLLRAPEVILEGAAGTVPFQVRGASVAGSGRDGRPRVRLELRGLDGRARAQPWKGAAVQVAAGSLTALAEGEYYWRELLGASCRLPDGSRLGVLEEIWPTPAHDVLVVRDRDRTTLLAASPQSVVRLDREKRELWIDPPAGLLASEEEAGS